MLVNAEQKIKYNNLVTYCGYGKLDSLLSHFIKKLFKKPDKRTLAIWDSGGQVL